jgi:hypothetical protein
MAKEPKGLGGKRTPITNTYLLHENIHNGAIGENRPSYST